jgi:hypothetical protein
VEKSELIRMMPDCVFCKHCSHDEELITHSRSGSVSIVGGALLCNHTKLKDIYYNTESGKRKPKKDEIDAAPAMPVLIGKVVWTCKGQFFEDAGSSMLGD